MVTDDKFYQGVAELFNAIPGIKNMYIVLVPKGYTFKFIADTSGLTIVNSKQELYGYLKREGVVAVYFHSLTSDQYYLVKHIPQKVKILWWSWGSDIYFSYHQSKALINIGLYEPLTQEYIKNREKEYPKYKAAVWFILRPLTDYLRKKIIQRVDFCKTVLPIEYEYLKKNKYFRADYFDYGGMKTFNCVHHTSVGNMIIGNSATATNNHLDIIEKLKHLNAERFEKIVFPINYGDSQYASYLKSNVTFNNAFFLETVLPFAEYSALYNSFTHAIFGHLRQQAIGNVTLAIRNSCKVFLYKDSIAYKQFKEKWGFIIYTIDDDLNDINLETPLTEEEEKYNYKKYIQVFGAKPRLEDELKRIGLVK